MSRPDQHLGRNYNDDPYDDSGDDNSFVPHYKQTGKNQGCAHSLGCLAAAVVLVIILAGAVTTEVAVPSSLMQNFVTINGDIKLAQVSVTPSRLRRHFNTTNITFFDNAGNPSYDSACNDCIMQGNGAQLQASIVNLPWWLKLFWHHAGCELTTLKSSQTAQHADIKILKSDDASSFQKVQQWGGEITHSNILWIPADGKQYNVFISADGQLYKEPVGQKD